MADNVIHMNNVTRLDLPAERVMDAVEEANLSDIVVVGYDADGDFYFASNKANGAEVLWLLETAKAELMDMARQMSE